MNLNHKIEQAEAMLSGALRLARAPVLMWSGGKDSMVLLHLLRRQGVTVPILHHRDDESGPQYAFADRIIAEWKLDVQDYLPLTRSLKQRGERIEIVAGYEIAPKQILVLPKNLFEAAGSGCGLHWLHAPTAAFDYPFDVILHGHKSSDVDEYEGNVPLKSNWVKRAGLPDLVFPLAAWTDADIWAYTRREQVPQDAGRYDLDTGANLPHREHNADWRNMCVRCLDLRAPAVVRCPQTGWNTPNVSRNVSRQSDITMPDYIGKE